MAEVVDAVVAGGGPAGAAAARRLATGGARVLLVDASPRGAWKVGEALPPSARPLLSSLGVWERFAGEGHLACHGNDVWWGSPVGASADFIFEPNGPGWHLDRPRFDAFLRDEAAAAGAEVRPGAVGRCRRTGAGTWDVLLVGGAAVRCAWVVDATGRRATVARHRGARRLAFDAAVAVVAPLTGPAGRVSRTLVEAVPDGWWYGALVPGDSHVVAYVTDRDLLPPAARTADGFSALLQSTDHVGPRLAGCVATGRPRTVAAGGACTEPAAGEGWLAVGDAAVAFDPISSQGIVTALYTGIVAADAVLDGASEGYGHRVATIAAAYRRNVARAYSLEHRWPDSPFWRRRVPRPGATIAGTRVAPAEGRSRPA